MIVSNGDMPINPLVMENGHPYHASHVCFENTPLVSGLTKRESIAKDLPKTDIEFGSTEDACEFIGQLEIPTSTIEMIRLSFAVEAKTRVMRADALLKELAK